MKFLLSVAILFSLISCNKNQDTKTEDIEIAKDTTVLTKNDISKINYIDYGVDKKAQTTLDSWQAYNTLAMSISRLKSADISFFKEDNTVFVSTIKDLESTIPETINTEPIQARLLILKTKLFKLEEALNLSTTEKEEKLLVIKELFEAFSNVTLQINKKFEKEAQSIIKPEEI